jgi:hypothetical protein
MIVMRITPYEAQFVKGNRSPIGGRKAGGGVRCL